MKIGIITNIDNKLSTYGAKYAQILNYNGLSHKIIQVKDKKIWDNVAEQDFILMAFPHEHREKEFGKRLLYILENEFKKPCFPNYREIVHYDEKVLQYWLFENNDIPIPATYLYFDRKEALRNVTEDLLPLVFKLSSGAGSNDVILVEKYEHAKQIINKIFISGIFSGNIPGMKIRKSRLKQFENYLKANYKRFIRKEFKPYHQKQIGYAYFQEYLPNNEFDTRVNIIGKRALAFRRNNRPQDFRASGSGLIDHDPTKIDKRCIQLAFEASKKLGFRNMAYDFLFNKENMPVIIESTYIYNDMAVYSCPGYWDEVLNWYKGNSLPQFLILKDFLKKELEHPPIDYFN